MEFLDFKNYSLWINAAIFAASAGGVWYAGTHLSRYGDAIARKTGVGHVAVGMVLLGGITGLPEVAVTLTSAVTQNAALAVNNLFGSIAAQVALLAIADAFIGKQALTVVLTSPSVLLQGTLNVLLLSVAAAVIAIGDVPFLGAGAWTWALLAMYLFSIWKISHSEGREPWTADNVEEQDRRNAKAERESKQHDTKRQQIDAQPLGSIAVRTAAAAVAILIAGFLLSRTGEAIADQTGLGQSFVGMVLLSIATSLPEISTVLTSVRLRHYEMAVADIFGSNLFDIGLIFVVDAVFPGKPVLNALGTFSVFASLLGIALTTLFLIGLIERRNRTVARMGIDSLAVIVVYFGGLFQLYQLR